MTGFPEILDGRVKTLHPKVHGGILARRGVPAHEEALKEHGIAPIDVVVVNLYPFEDKVAKGAAFDEAVENVDIGGPTMLRAAAKNFRDVAVVVDPADYPLLLEQLDRKGGLDAATRLYFAQKAFRHTARYEAAIAGYFAQVEARDGAYAVAASEDVLPLSPRPVLREGAGPALRREPAPARRVLQRPRLDPLLGGGGAQGAGQGALVQQHPRPRRGLAAGHRAPRPGLRDRQAHQPLRHRRWARGSPEAYERAWACDPRVRLRRDRRLQPARGRRRPRARLAEVFVEAVIAPGFEGEAKKALAAKKNLRVMDMDTTSIHRVTGFDLRRVMGGVLAQEWDLHTLDRAKCEVVHASASRPRRSGRRCSWPGRW